MVLISTSPMEVDRQRNHDGQQNGCRSFGSEFRSSAQSRKVSIGILAEQNGKLRYGGRTETGVAVKSTNLGVPGQKVPEEIENGPEIVASLKDKHAKDPSQKTSPWISTKAFTPPEEKTYQIYMERTVLNSKDSAPKTFNRVNGTSKSNIVQLYAKQSLVLQSDGLQKKFNGVAYGSRNEKQGNTERVEKFAFATTQEVHVSDKGTEARSSEKRENRKNYCLKQKLWEALETVPSQIEISSDSKDFKEGKENLKSDENIDNKPLKPKQNSDTIETLSESPNISPKRPLTRSLARKKASTASKPKLKHTFGTGGKLPTNLSYKWAHQEKNIFTFNEEAEEESRSLNRTSNTSLTSKSERKKNIIQPRKIFFSEQKNPEKIREATKRRGGPPASSKTPSHSSRVEKSHINPSENDKWYLQSTNGIRKEELHHSSESKKENPQKDLSSPDLPKTSSTQEDLCSDHSEKNADPQCGVDSPTLGMKTNINSFFNPPSPKSIHTEQGIQSPAQNERRSTLKGIYNLRTRQKPKQGSSGYNEQTDSSDDSEDLEESPIRESSPVMEKVDATHKSSQSSEDQEEENMEEDQPINKGFMCMGATGSGNPEESPLAIRPTKRLRRNGLSSILPTRKGAEEINELLQPSEENQEDDLSRAVGLFSLALERFKSKIHTQTNKKSSEILASVAEEIQSQLQNVNSQIQKDVLKFTNVGKSKRKSVETRLQEQQERLKSMQEKIKEEVSQHLQECKSTFEDLEAFQIELKGDAKRQKALYQKLLLQVEEAIESQLSEADRRITALHKVARGNMFQLKHVITECLKEGVFN